MAQARQSLRVLRSRRDNRPKRSERSRSSRKISLFSIPRTITCWSIPTILGLRGQGLRGKACNRMPRKPCVAAQRCRRCVECECEAMAGPLWGDKGNPVGGAHRRQGGVCAGRVKVGCLYRYPSSRQAGTASEWYPYKYPDRVPIQAPGSPYRYPGSLYRDPYNCSITLLSKMKGLMICTNASIQAEAASTITS